VTSPGRLVLMRESAVHLARPNAAEEIIDHCEAALGGGARRPSSNSEVAPCNGD
jgi:hypothetical protein